VVVGVVGGSDDCGGDEQDGADSDGERSYRGWW
jgi:hypothetical protein